MDSSGGAEAAGGAIAMVIGCMFWLFWLAVVVVTVAGMWKVFVKAGKPGWAAIIPIYNAIVLAEICGKPILWGILTLIPCVGIVVVVLLCLELAKKFGKEPVYGIGLALLGPIFWPMLGFGSAQYQGGGAAPQQ